VLNIQPENTEERDPRSLRTLRDLPKIATTSVPHNALHGVNLGHDTLLLAVPMHKFFEISEVANAKTVKTLAESGETVEVTQRPLDPKHAAKLGMYILKGLTHATLTFKEQNGEAISNELRDLQSFVGTQPYIALQPIVANLNKRADELHIESSRAGVITAYLSDRDVLWVVDGQHRRFAMQLVFEFLRHVRDRREYPKRAKVFIPPRPLTEADVRAWSEIFEIGRQFCNVAVEVHLGLSDEAERQLFHDLNNLGKKVESSLSFEFDYSNPVNRFIKDELEIADFWKPEIVTKDIVNWSEDRGVISRKDLIVVNAHLMLNTSNVKGATHADVTAKTELAMRFWESINRIAAFGENGAKRRTVAAQTVVLKALAKLFYDFAWGKQRNQTYIARLIAGIENGIDFSHSNPMWRYYELSDDAIVDRQLVGLRDYLPSDTEGANRDIGKFDSNDGVMRFGTKHNDIYPLLGDMIRWRLELPSRHNRELPESETKTTEDSPS
jgi:DNA-sulfur modification-associated